MEDKKQFFEIYQKVKKEEMNIKTLDSKTILKILQMLNEEIKINVKRIAQKTEEYEKLLKDTKKDFITNVMRPFSCI